MMGFWYSDAKLLNAGQCAMNDATDRNLKRKSVFIDDVQLVDGVPLFSWIDVNVTELCNRTCSFCPRGDQTKYSNQNLNMSLDLAERIAHELFDLDYAGTVVFSGFGESLLHPNLLSIINKFAGTARLELVTNGDRLDEETIRALYVAGIGFFAVSLYDGPEQLDDFHVRFEEAGVSQECYILRDRWHSEGDGFGLKLTNRAGMVNVGKQPPVDTHHPCFYTAYSLAIDWNGDVLLCVQDWNKRKVFGNLYDQSLLEVWKHNKDLNGMRNRLIGGKRIDLPCALCNAEGTVHGANHAKAWGRL